MRLATIAVDGQERPALVTAAGHPVPLADAYRNGGLEPQLAPASIRELIRQFDRVGGDVRRAAASIESGGRSGSADETISWLPPIPDPSKILGCAINNAALNRMARAHTDNPPFFVKLPSSLLGHGEAVVIRPDYGLTHPEGELAVVIGRRCSRLEPSEVPDAVFGYTIINDITSITLKSEDTYVFANPGADPAPPGFEHGDMHLVYHARSKGTDGFGPCGPWIVTADEISDPDNLSVQVLMGDEVCASDSTANLRFGVAEVISWLTRYVTLEPGDLVHMGTAARGRYALRELDFQAWDGPCTVRIEGIGQLSNPIARYDLAGNPVARQARNDAEPWPPRIPSPVEVSR